MRDLSKVIDQMLEVIPEDEYGFRNDLLSLQKSVMYSAPELMGLRWRTGADILADRINLPYGNGHEWKDRVVAIWVDDTHTSRDSGGETT